jgi:hypothetical protein
LIISISKKYDIMIILQKFDTCARVTDILYTLSTYPKRIRYASVVLRCITINIAQWPGVYLIISSMFLIVLIADMKYLPRLMNDRLEIVEILPKKRYFTCYLLTHIFQEQSYRWQCEEQDTLPRPNILLNHLLTRIICKYV